MLHLQRPRELWKWRQGSTRCRVHPNTHYTALRRAFHFTGSCAKQLRKFKNVTDKRYMQCIKVKLSSWKWVNVCSCSRRRFVQSFVCSFVALPFELLLQRKNDERRTTNDGRRTTKRRSMDCYEVSTAINAFDETTE